MSLSSYRILCTIVEQGSMTKAANLLHITPSAVTHAMNALDETVGFPLLNRDKGKISLTTQGEVIYPQIRRILEEESRLQEEISQVNGMERGRVRLGVFNSVCVNWMPTIVRRFSRKYPNIEIEIMQGSYQEIEDQMLSSLIDVGFVSLPCSSHFQTITVAHDRMLCITPKEFRPANPNYVSAEDLRNQPLIIGGRGFDRGLQEYIERHHLDENRRHSIALESSAIALVEGGMGCSIVPELILHQMSGNYNVYPLSDNIYRTLALATLKGRTHTMAVTKMIQEIRTAVEGVSFID